MSYDLKSSTNSTPTKSKKKQRPQLGGLDQNKSDVDRFFNKDENISITWYSSLKEYYNAYLMERLEIVDKITEGGKKSGEMSKEKA